MSATWDDGMAGRLSRRPILVLVLLCVVAWLPGVFALPPLDRDESRFAQASKQMIESGDYIDIRFSTVPRYNKPVGVYWLQAAATRLLGKVPYNQIWTYRVPSLFGALLAVLLTYWCALAFASRETALLGAALLGSSLLLSAEAQIATTDALLLATILAAQGVLLRSYLFARGQIASSPTRAGALAGWAAVGAGLLLKGPVVLAVAGLTVVALSLWDWDWKWLRHIRAARGVLVLLAVVLPWAIAIAVASHGAFYQRSLGHDFAAKIMGGQETHGAPPGYYLALAAITFWPATLFALPAAACALVQRSQPAVRFLLAWTVPTWLLFELVPTKLPHYILPVYPALALLSALPIRRPQHPETRFEPGLRIFGAVLFLAVALMAVAAAIILPRKLVSTIQLSHAVAAAVIMALAVAAAVLQLRRRSVSAAVCAIAGAILLYPVIAAGIAPSLTPVWMSGAIAARLTADRLPRDPPVVLAGYLEPSLVFLLGTDTRLESGRAAASLAARQGGLAVIADRQRAQFLQTLQAAHAGGRAVDQISGFDYSRGRREHVIVYRVTPAPQAR